jgi:hypothetical protein
MRAHPAAHARQCATIPHGGDTGHASSQTVNQIIRKKNSNTQDKEGH